MRIAVGLNAALLIALIAIAMPIIGQIKFNLHHCSNPMERQNFMGVTMCQEYSLMNLVGLAEMHLPVLIALTLLPARALLDLP